MRSHRGGRHEALLQLAVVGRHVLQAAGAAAGGTVHAVARVAEAGGEGLRRTAVQVTNGRGTEALGIGGAHQQVIHRTPLQAELVVDRVTEGVEVRVTGGSVEGQFLGTRHIGQDRHVQLQVELVNGVGAVGRAGGQVGRVTRLGDGVRGEAALFLAVFITQREAQVAGRQGEQRAGQVGEVVVGLAQADSVFFLVQLLDHVRIIQRVGHCTGTETGKRVPRGAGRQCDRGGSGTALDHALGIQERRTDSGLDARDVEVAVVDDAGVGFAEHVASVPVEVTLTDVERTFQRSGEAPLRDGGVGGTRHFPATTTPVDGAGATGRVEVAVGCHRRADRSGLGRVTGDLAVGLTTGVTDVRGEAHVVGDVVVGVHIQRTAFQRGQQHHLIVGVAGVSAGLRVELVRAQGGAATVRSLPCTGRTDRAPVAPLADRGQAQARPVHRIRLGREPAVLGPDGLFFVRFSGDGDRAALTGKAQHHVVGLLGAVALAVLADIGIGFGAGEVLAGDDVDHAGHGVGAVDRGGAVLQHFNALDHHGRDGGHVLETVRADGQTLAIDQHQGALGAQVAQVDVLATGFLVGGQRGGAAEARAAGGRNVLQDIADRGEALGFDVLARNAQNRLRSGDINLADTRTGDFQAVQGGGGILREHGAGGTGSANGQCDQHGVTQLALLAIHALSLSKRVGTVS